MICDNYEEENHCGLIYLKSCAIKIHRVKDNQLPVYFYTVTYVNRSIKYNWTEYRMFFSCKYQSIGASPNNMSILWTLRICQLQILQQFMDYERCINRAYLRKQMCISSLCRCNVISRYIALDHFHICIVSMDVTIKNLVRHRQQRKSIGKWTVSSRNISPHYQIAVYFRGIKNHTIWNAKKRKRKMTHSESLPCHLIVHIIRSFSSVMLLG